MPAPDLDSRQQSSAFRAVPTLMSVRSNVAFRELVRLCLVLDGRLQHILHRLKQLFQLINIQSVDLGSRVNSSLKQDFIRLNIADPRQGFLAHQ